MQIDAIPELEFVWGVKSYDDLSNEECNLYTMNDIDILYDKESNTYRLGIETIFQFDKDFEGELNYINGLFESFTSWMKSKGYNTRKKPSYDVFDIFNHANKFYSIEDLYATFKCLVFGLNQMVNET